MTTTQPVTFPTGRAAYEDDLAIDPRYHDGSPRPCWDALPYWAQMSWNRNPTRRASPGPDALIVGQRYEVASGMGGTFDAKLVGLTDDRAHWRVDMPRNPDWHGHRFETSLKVTRLHLPR